MKKMFFPYFLHPLGGISHMYTRLCNFFFEIGEREKKNTVQVFLKIKRVDAFPVP